MIEINHLVKKYGNHTAVDDLTMQIEEGKIYGFLGPNGAGKSTTMNIMTGYLGASAGEVIIDGYNMMKHPDEAKRCIGYLPEIPPLYTDMTVEEYLDFAAELKKLPKSARKSYVNDAMERLKLTDVRSRLIQNLSKGYKQRVGFAQAILGYPKIIILDEPTVGLDPKQIIEIRELIYSLKEKHTVILSSHILSEIREVCDYIFILSKGKLVASDTTENLMQSMKGSGMDMEILLKDTSAAKALLGQLEEIKEIAEQDGTEENTKKLLVHIESEEDIRSQLIELLVNGQVPILEVKTVTHSLEDVFMELTEQSTVDKEEEAEHDSNI